MADGQVYKIQGYGGYQDGTHVCGILSQKARQDSSTGVRGVYPTRSGTYNVQLTFQGKTYRAYGFVTVESAAKERQNMYDEIVQLYLDSIAVGAASHEGTSSSASEN